jgi:elongation factor G
MTKIAELARVRNIGVAAHVDAGKTTLTERILYYTGASHKIGEVHEGAAHMDYMAEEQSHGITITSAVTKAPWRDHTLQIVDTPGHVDFTIEVERSMRVLDGCILVLDGVRGVEPQTETVWRQRSRFKLPVVFFINKMDRPGADFDHALEHIRSRLRAAPVPLTVPLLGDGLGARFARGEPAVLHLIDRTLIRFTGDQGSDLLVDPCPADLWEAAQGYREALLLAAAEYDDALADLVLGGGEPEPAAIRAALRRGTLAGRLCPCYGGSALRNLGVQPLLDGVIDFLPAPLDRPPALATRPDGSTESVALGDTGPLVALAFKVQMWEGRRHVFTRIYRNHLRPGDPVEIRTPDGRTVREQVARIFEVDAGKKTKLDVAAPGQIVLLAGLRHATTGDTLCQPGHPLSLERIELRAPVLSLAIEPAMGTDPDKLNEALDKVEQEDPTLKVEEDPETGQRLLRGMGELHLQIVMERLQREYGLVVRSGRPSVAVRETIAAQARGDVLFAPPTLADHKGPGLRARVLVEVAPRGRATGNTVSVQPRALPEGSQLTQAQIQSIEQGIRRGLSAGPLQGTPLEDVAVRVPEVELFGPASTVDALAAAASRALGRALEAAQPALLQPVMAVEVVVPSENLGTVLGDLQSRRALIRHSESRGPDVTIDAEVALERLLGYTTDLRSQTQGRGQFSMQFARFDLV